MTQTRLSILQSIAAYVPQRVVGQALAAETSAAMQQAEHVEAALLFADVSGFTAMSENLARLGKEGAEELTRVLSAYFTAMIDLVHRYGGQVIKFGGDAITCAFACRPASDALDEAPIFRCVLSACACALTMQERMGAFQAVETRGETFQLRMKIGISAGKVLSLSVGSVDEGLEYVLAGTPLDRMSQAEHHASAGEVVIDGACLESTERTVHDLRLVTGENREGFLLIEGLDRPAHPLEGGSIAWETLSAAEIERAIERLVPYLPPTVYERIVEGQREFVGEHRRVTSMFVNFAGIDYTQDPEAGSKLHRYFTGAQEIVHRYGGRLNRVTTGDKGSLLHIIFGAPVAHEDNEERAVGCALALQQRGADLPFITEQRIGIASGYVFAGQVGAEWRREYTTMGDVVNLSARLMQAAALGEVLLDQRTARAATEEFVCHDLEPIKVKGKQEPVAVCQAVSPREAVKVWGDERATARRTSPI
ncbi:MAG: adenylate/guanylate cyclase domain-containing protein, partial [Anaerolineae bacterium]|nr:adenylate/guanylate cyclase domain-containing protein [Anaerolineae bacterium]